MKRVNSLGLLLIIALLVISATLLVHASMTNSKRVNSPTATTPQQTKPDKDPCWFMALKDESIPYQVIKEREDRNMHGYASPIALSEAVRVFNEERKCVGSLASYPDLTEAEVLAAIVAGPDSGNQGEIWQAKKGELWKIASQKLMPKGSLLVVDGGYRIQDSPLRPSGTIEARGIRIALLLGLESREHGEQLEPSQTLIIRKIFTGIETVK